MEIVGQSHYTLNIFVCKLLHEDLNMFRIIVRT